LGAGGNTGISIFSPDGEVAAQAVNKRMPAGNSKNIGISLNMNFLTPMNSNKYWSKSCANPL
jgi:hypothetical protein